VLSGAYLLIASIFTMETSKRSRFYAEEVEEHSEEGTWLVLVQKPKQLEMKQLLSCLKAYARSPMTLEAAGELGGKACMGFMNFRRVMYLRPKSRGGRLEAKKRERLGYTRIYPVTELDRQMAGAFGLVVLDRSEATPSCSGMTYVTLVELVLPYICPSSTVPQCWPLNLHIASIFTMQKLAVICRSISGRLGAEIVREHSEEGKLLVHIQKPLDTEMARAYGLVLPGWSDPTVSNDTTNTVDSCPPVEDTATGTTTAAPTAAPTATATTTAAPPVTATAPTATATATADKNYERDLKRDRQRPDFVNSPDYSLMSPELIAKREKLLEAFRDGRYIEID
jgi:hypothetical protein